MLELRYYADGDWRKSTSGKLVDILNPCTGSVFARVQACTQSEVDLAFESAKVAQRAWQEIPLWKRAEAIHALAAQLRKHQDTLGHLLMTEVAKPIKDSIKEVVRSADLLSYTAEEAVRTLGEGNLLFSDSFKGHTRDKLCMEMRVPLGTVLAIPPFNYPINLAVSKIGPALMAGNAVILKPPTQGAVSGLHLVQCLHLTNLFPPGLVTAITGKGGEIGDYMTTHDGVDCISFTGGDTGLSISAKVGMLPLQMELGGKDVAIICPDADLNLAAKHVIAGGFGFNGQRCTAVKLVLAHRDIASTLMELLVFMLSQLRVGMPEDNADITPVISSASADFIESLVRDAQDKGAAFPCGEWRREGNLIWPLLIDNVTSAMRISSEEPFGPVLPVMRVNSIDEAVTICNGSRYALQGSLFTADINDAMLVSARMSVGTVQINAAPARGPDHFPFQGLRDSGIGSQGVRNSLQLMTKVRSIVMNLPSPSFTSA